MQSRRVVAATALVLLVGGVVALSLTGGADDPDDAAPVESTTESAAGSSPADGEPAASDPPSSDSDATEAEPTTAETTANTLRYDPALVPELPDRGEHLPLIGIDGWLQSDVESLDELRGKVVAVQFWTFGCFNCKNTMPHMAALYEKYGGDDFEIVGVHAPEFDREKDPQRIADAAADQDVSWPIALDTEKETFRSWQTGRRFWPRIYLIDRDGSVRYDKIGEGRYDEIDAAVGALIDEPWDGALEADLEEWVERDVDLNSDPM